MFYFPADPCGARTIYLTEGTTYNLTSPKYPDNYPSNLNCTWRIQSDDPNGFIQINILDFTTEYRDDRLTISSPGLSLGQRSASWFWAKHTITDSDELELYGSTDITSLLSRGNQTDVMFTSDSSTSKRGFKLEIRMRHSGKILMY